MVMLKSPTIRVSEGSLEMLSKIGVIKIQNALMSSFMSLGSRWLSILGIIIS
jgi:hypothetical protein